MRISSHFFEHNESHDAVYIAHRHNLLPTSAVLFPCLIYLLCFTLALFIAAQMNLDNITAELSMTNQCNSCFRSCTFLSCEIFINCIELYELSCRVIM